MALTISVRKVTGVYLAACTATGEFYIGSSVDVRRRWRQHRNQLRYNRSTCPALQTAWNQHPEQLSFAVLQECSDAELLDTEQKFIDQLKPALNTAPWAGSTVSVRLTPEQRERLKLRPQSIAKRHVFRGKELTVPEIALALGMSEPGVYRRLQQGRMLDAPKSSTAARK